MLLTFLSACYWGDSEWMETRAAKRGIVGFTYGVSFLFMVVPVVYATPNFAVSSIVLGFIEPVVIARAQTMVAKASDDTNHQAAMSANVLSAAGTVASTIVHMKTINNPTTFLTTIMHVAILPTSSSMAMKTSVLTNSGTPTTLWSIYEEGVSVSA
ncbi:hypothetical protein H072_8724 [Dactylellina haptotyla CBS 200.50]|uniref:Uncharacterized protein n=1 Tax=Dactylellina haptotyla (strain CBS 200.50) TaxID=1284197 RepID=S8BE88_DACHA|nr:hypothetical protein H072_8724 [Dactylellina haptotyla CBS 200.50]